MKNLNRWARLAAGVVIMLFAGIIYAWSILKAPLLQEFQWTNAQLGVNFTITMGCFCLGGILGGKMLEKMPPNNIVCLGAFLALLGFFLSSRMTGNIAILYISYGICCGLGVGMVYNAVIAAVTSWFPDKRATASGAMMMGFGVSSLILGSAANQIINLQGWRWCYLALGIAIFIVLLAGSLFIAVNPQKKTNAPGAESGAGDSSPGQMLRKSSFWKFYIYLVLIGAIGTGVISYAKDISLSFGMSEINAVLSVGLLSVCNGLGRILFGWLYDNAGKTAAFFTSSTMALVAVGLLFLTLIVPTNLIGLLAFITVGLSYGSVPTLSSGFVASAFGLKHFSVNFSIANTLVFVASMSSTIGGRLQSSSENFLPIFIMFLICAVAALFLCVSMKGNLAEKK